MQQQMVKINTGKFTNVKGQFASNLDKLSSGITQLTAMDGGVTPEQVSEVLSAEVLPAIEGVKNIIAQIDEALPTADGGELGGEGLGGEGLGGEEPETGVLSAMDDEDTGEGDDEIQTGSDASDAALQKKLQHMEASMNTLLKENVGMKKASLAKLYASNFPPHMRTAMEAEFLKENEDEELDAMEAKLNTASKLVNSYKTAGLLKKSNIPVGSGTYHSAKDTTKSGSKGQSTVPWNMR